MPSDIPVIVAIEGMLTEWFSHSFQESIYFQKVEIISFREMYGFLYLSKAAFRLCLRMYHDLNNLPRFPSKVFNYCASLIFAVDNQHDSSYPLPEHDSNVHFTTSTSLPSHGVSLIHVRLRFFTALSPQEPEQSDQKLHIDQLPGNTPTAEIYMNLQMIKVTYIQKNIVKTYDK